MSQPRRIEITRAVEVRAIHHLSNPALSPNENVKLYGICSRRHGHHYEIQVTVTGDLDPDTGLVCNRDELDRVLRSKIVEPFDGVDLNRIFPNTSCEAIAVEFKRLLENELKGQWRLVRVSIQETAKNYIEFPAKTW